MTQEILKTIGLEGGATLTQDPTDPGGLTKYGISKKSNPDVDIAALTQDQAVAIYQDRYWSPLHLDQYQNIQYRWKLFDIAVNQGVATAQTFAPLVHQPDTLAGVFELVEMQMKRYIAKLIANPQLVKYIRGWSNRAFDQGEELI